MKFFNYLSMQEATCARLSVFEYEYINNYDKILYLDTDIILQNDLSSIFNCEIEDKIYALPEGTIEHEYHGGWFFDWKVIDKDTPGLNSGILLFKNSNTVRTIFTYIRSHISEMKMNNATMPACQDQPFINYHCIKNGNQDTQLLTKYALIYCIDPPPPPSEPTSIVACHFVWPIGNAEHKRNRMVNHVAHILNNYTKVYPNDDAEAVSSIIGKAYRWGDYGEIRFEADKLVTTWGIGTYEILDSRTANATWHGYAHVLRFNESLTTYFSVRISDMDYITGSLKS